MFLIWGSKWKYEEKPGGLRIRKSCPECGCSGEFIEVKPVKYFTVYFIPLFETESKRTVLECPQCKSHFYLNESDYSSAREEAGQPRPGKESGKETNREANRQKVVIECSCCGQQLRVPVMEKMIRIHCTSCGKELHVASGELL